MNKVVMRSSEPDDFFTRAKAAAKRADQGDQFDGTITLSFADPQRMFSVLTKARRNLMHELIQQPKTINELSIKLNRNRSAISKDVNLLEKAGLLVSKVEANPGHGVHKLVQAVASKIEITATLA